LIKRHVQRFSTCLKPKTYYSGLCGINYCI